MLHWRLALGLLLIAMLAGLCVLDARAEVACTWLLPLALVLCALAASEVLRLLAGRSLQPSTPLVYIGCLTIVASNAVSLVWPNLCQPPLGVWGSPVVAFTLAMLVAFCDEIRRYQKPGEAVMRLVATGFSLYYVGLLFSFLVQLRLIDVGFSAEHAHNHPRGIVAVASLVIVVKMCDTGAYTVGRLAGRNKMTPRLSPGKTLEGAIGGIAWAVLGSWLTFTFLSPWIQGNSAGRTAWWGWLAYGVIVGLAGMFGDLAESLIKRDTGSKDSSTWMPGFGGVLDVLDSILFAAPVAYLCWIAGLVS